MSTLAVPGLGLPEGLMVLADGNWLVSTAEDTILALLTSGQVAVIAGSKGEEGFAEGEGAAARFNGPTGITVDPAGCMVVADSGNKGPASPPPPAAAAGAPPCSAHPWRHCRQ